MLNIIFGKIDNVIFNTSVFFKNSYEENWLLEKETQQMIFDIDRSKVKIDDDDVDYKKAGSYEITYSVKAGKGPKGSVKLIVIVTE